MGKLIIASVPMNMIEMLWHKIEPMVERVIKTAPNDLYMPKIKNDLIVGNTLLITVSDNGELVAINILETHTYPTGHKVLYVPMSAGDRLYEWLEDLLNILHDVARDFKCDEIRVSGRKGWIRKLKEFGWYDNHVTIGCKVKEAQNVSRKEQKRNLTAV